MKKILLSAACMAMSMSLCAGNPGDYFKVVYADEERESGFELVCNDWWEDEDVDPETGELIGLGTGAFMPLPVCVNSMVDTPIVLQAALEFGEVPTEAQFNEEGIDVWGDKPSLCFEGGGPQGNQMNCLAPGAEIVTIPSYEYHTFKWDLHKLFTPRIMTKWVFKFWPTADPSAVFVVNLTFGSDFAGIQTVTDADFDPNAPKEYYNLQGVRVANPQKGMYIVRQGGKTYKQVVK